jgi:hypothetical protein
VVFIYGAYDGADKGGKSENLRGLEPIEAMIEPCAEETSPTEKEAKVGNFVEVGNVGEVFRGWVP